jgi:hypothetical protein
MYVFHGIRVNHSGILVHACDGQRTHTHTHTSPFRPGETEAARDRVKRGLRERDCETELHTQREI